MTPDARKAPVSHGRDLISAPMGPVPCDTGGSPSQRRPRVAVVATTYFADSHADVVATRLMDGYWWDGVHVNARIQVASLYLEQLGEQADAEHPRRDIGVDVATRNGVPTFATVAEAVGCGRPGVAVDGVVIVGEHGDYEYNELGQQLYPRRRLFDSAVSTMIGAGQFVPVYVDKHLAHSFTDARAMYDTARRLHIPVLAGSSVPLAWRIPTGGRWPIGEPMQAALCVGYGPVERYGFHILEGLQAETERRAGGETGVSAVTALSGPAALRAVEDGSVDLSLLRRALGTFNLTEGDLRRALDSVEEVFLVEYADGLTAAAVNCWDVVRNFGVACRGPGHEMACQIWLQSKPHGHFTFLVRQIESLMLTRAEPYPLERTLLTTGILDAAMHSRHRNGLRLPTPELAIAYQPAAKVADTAVDRALPAG